MRVKNKMKARINKLIRTNNKTIKNSPKKIQKHFHKNNSQISKIKKAKILNKN